MTQDTARNDGPRESMTFEQALAQLDETVRALEAGDVSLSEATRLYEEGMKLSRLCGEKLSDAELKIGRIQDAYGEQMRLPGGADGPPC